MTTEDCPFTAISETDEIVLFECSIAQGGCGAQVAFVKPGLGAPAATELFGDPELTIHAGWAAPEIAWESVQDKCIK